MAWEGIKSAIPPALIQILIEKVISMIVPAAGAVLAIIEGLQAAWGTVSRVIQAFDRFMGFLKAVKTGQSGPQFGAALAAAGVVLIDFVSNWLLKRVRGAASKVAGKIKEIAKKIGRKLKAATKKLGGKFGKAKDKFFGKEKGDKGKGKEGEHSKKETDKQREAQERLKKAETELKAKLAKGMTGIRLKAYLALLKAKYRLKVLKVDQSGKNKVKIFGKVNPEFEVMAEVIRDDTQDEGIPDNQASKLEVLFRAMNLQELTALREFKVLTTRKDKKGKPQGQPFITTNEEYSKKLMHRKWEDGDKQKDEGTKKMYEYLVRIEFRPGTEAMLQDPQYARVEGSNLATRRRFPKKQTGIPDRAKGERGIVVLKMEPLYENQAEPRILNYGITPKDFSADDPLQKLNAQIVRITVIGRIKE
jgi:hypothetical protein